MSSVIRIKYADKIYDVDVTTTNQPSVQAQVEQEGGLPSKKVHGKKQKSKKHRDSTISK